ncbi:MAG TPA: type II CAAX endopeptidase family protein [Pyrinomonadaceae bacterium]|nr:type II CAAX endopeptidase family protein [Pyrinomonadaceae bacterium]
MHTPDEVAPLPIPASPDSTYLDQFPAKENFQSVDPNNPVWGIGGALLVWIASILVQIVVPLFFVIPFAIHRGLNPASPEFARSALELAITDATGIFLQIVAILPTHLISFALLWALVTRFGKRPFLSSLGWGWSNRLRFWQSVGLGITLFLAAWPLAVLLGSGKPTQLEQLINSSVAARYAIAFLAVFTAPFIEEFTYRGVLYSALQRAIGVRGAVIFILALFTVIHVPQYWPNLGVISAVALLSIVLTIVRARTGRLLPCIIIHMSFNAVQAALLLVGPYLQRFLPSTEPAVPTVSILFPLIHLIF